MTALNLSALAVRERAVTLFFLLLAVVAGLYAFLTLGRAEDPAYLVRVMVVSAAWPGATAEQMREQVANPLEQRIQEVENLDFIETSARPGWVDMQIQFHDYTPSAQVPELFYQVRKRMLDAAPRLPRGVQGPFVNDEFSDVYYTLLALTAPELEPRLLAREAERLRDRVAAIPGVRKTVLLGERPERVFIDFDTAHLAGLGIAPGALLEAIEAHNRLVPAGLFETEGARVHLRLDADLADLAALRAVPVRAGDRLLRLGDVAEVRRGYEEPPAYLARAWGEEAVFVGAVMGTGVDGQDLGRRMEQFLEAERAQLPLGMQLSQITNQADAIREAIEKFEEKFLIAVVVVTAVSLAVLGLRAGMVVAVAIPITLGLTFLLMKLTHVNLDRVTLGALIVALGLLVDDAIISIEMMLVQLTQGLSRAQAAARSWSITAAPMLFGTLVTTAGFVPIGFAESAVGEYAGNIFWVLAYALIVSWLVAVTFTPYLGMLWLRSPPTADHEGAELYRSGPYRRLRRLIAAAVRWRILTVAVTIVALVIAIGVLAGGVEKQFFPSSNRTEVLVDIYLPQGSAIAATDRVVRRIEALLAGSSDLRALSAFVGAGAPRFFHGLNPQLPNPAFATILAVAFDREGRDRVMADLDRRVEAGEFPEARVRVHRLIYGPPARWPVEFRVLGPDRDELRRIGHAVRAVMARNPHCVDPHLEWDERVPVLHLELEPERLRRIGLTPRAVAEQLQFQFDGVTVTELRQDIRTVELRARGARANLSADELGRIELKTFDERTVPLAQLGQIAIRHEDPVVKRYNRDPFVAVGSIVRDAQPLDVTRAVWADLGELRAALPAGYRIEIGGFSEQSIKADTSVQRLQPLMAVLMLAFVMLQMRSFAGTFMVIATAPLGVIGAVAGLTVCNQAFGFVAMLGLIGLAGILMRNTLILTQQVTDNLAADMEPMDAVIEAAVRRARPVVLTAAAAILAFLPLVSDSFWGPMATVLIGGLAVGTVLTLLFVPALYALWYRLPRLPAN